MQRTKQSVKNASFSIGAQLIQQLMKMLVRIAFIRVIGQPYLGINSLFTDILIALQLVELGIGPAIAYSLYKPLSCNDTEKVKSLMALFRKAYRIIGILILVGGICFMPFYPFFIKEMLDVSNLNFIYLIFVFDTAVSYFNSYYRTLLVSDQKKYKDMIIQTAVTFGISVLQIVAIYVIRDYMSYLALQVIGTILTNFLASRVAKKEYPYLKEKEAKKLDDETFKEIKKNVVAMVFHKIGGIIRDATDNLIISKYIGIIMAGVYSTYAMLAKALNTLISQIFSAVLSSVGNLHVTRSEEAQKEVFYNINFINFWIASMFACCFGVLSSSFVLVISNESYVLDLFVVVIVSLRFYLDTMRKTPWMFCEAAGIYWQGRTKPLWEVIVNLITSIILVKTIGLPGVFIGTIITILVVDLPIEPYLVFKYVLKGGLAKYYKKYAIYLLVTAIMYIATYFTCSLVPLFGKGVIAFILKGIVALITTNLIVVLTMFKTDEFKYTIDLAKKYITKFINMIRGNKDIKVK